MDFSASADLSCSLIPPFSFLGFVSFPTPLLLFLELLAINISGGFGVSSLLSGHFLDALSLSRLLSALPGLLMVLECCQLLPEADISTRGFAYLLCLLVRVHGYQDGPVGRLLISPAL